MEQFRQTKNVIGTQSHEVPSNLIKETTNVPSGKDSELQVIFVL